MCIEKCGFLNIRCGNGGFGFGQAQLAGDQAGEQGVAESGEGLGLLMTNGNFLLNTTGQLCKRGSNFIRRNNNRITAKYIVLHTLTAARTGHALDGVFAKCGMPGQ